MSLPKTSSEMAAAAENFLHFQQESSVPWKTRAKRGFATHPRSIAERVWRSLSSWCYLISYNLTSILIYHDLGIKFQMRRTRISERIKRLQELFPDMDKVKKMNLKCKLTQFMFWKWNIFCFKLFCSKLIQQIC